MQNFIDELRSNPLLDAIIVFVAIIAIYFVHKNLSAPSTTTPSVAPEAATTEPAPVIKNTYNTYPTVQPPQSVGCNPGYTFVPGASATNANVTDGSYATSGGWCVPNKVVPPPPVPPPVPPPPKPPVPPPPPPKPQMKYFTVTTWPQPGSSLFSIAQIEHTSLAHIEGLNPQIKDFNLIYPGQQVRVA